MANEPKTFVRMQGSNHSTLTRDGVYPCYWRFLGLPYEKADAGVCLAPAMPYPGIGAYCVSDIALVDVDAVDLDRDAAVQHDRILPALAVTRRSFR
ncbi:MAG: hypothetical protein WDN06_11260 [Asticcacaulis sp.]